MSLLAAPAASAEDVSTDDAVIGTGPGQPCVIVAGTTVGTSGVKFGTNSGVYTDCPV